MFADLILEKLILPQSITTIKMGAFQYTNLSNITIPSSVTTIEPLAFFTSRALESFLVEEGNNSFISENGVLFNKDKTTLICYPAYKEGTEYSIPEDVNTIYGGAFAPCKLETIIIPSSIKEIGSLSFLMTPALKKIHCKASNPPTATGAFMPGELNLSDVTLYVPNGTKDTYAVTEGWKIFTNIVEE